MKNIFLALAVIGLSFASCKKQAQTPPNSNAHTTQPPVTSGDSVWIDVRIEAPQSASFNYHYDSTNTRILLNGHGMGGTSQSFYWYLGGKFKYTWVKP